MRILIMVLSYQDGVFADFLNTQIDTWDSLSVDDIDTCYYTGHSSDSYDWMPTALNGGIIKCPASDEYNMMHWKFKKALDGVNYKDYDFIFRTNSCSYIRKDKLQEVAATLPKTGCYAGWDNGGYVSGAGIWFSPDVLEVVHKSLTDQPHYAEDVLIGEILRGFDISNHQVRHDVGVEVATIPETYHYRCKTSNIHEERVRDINNMKKVHELITA